MFPSVPRHALALGYSAWRGGSFPDMHGWIHCQKALLSPTPPTNIYRLKLKFSRVNDGAHQTQHSSSLTNDIRIVHTANRQPRLDCGVYGIISKPSRKYAKCYPGILYRGGARRGIKLDSATIQALLMTDSNEAIGRPQREKYQGHNIITYHFSKKSP